MINTLEIVGRMQAALTSAMRDQIIYDAFMAGNVEFFQLARRSLDPLITFGVTKVAALVEDDGLEGDFTVADFLALADRLYHRHLTGDAARTALVAAAQRCNFRLWNLLYRPVLQKKLPIDGRSYGRVLTKLADYPQTAACMASTLFWQVVAPPAKLVGRQFVDGMTDGERILAVLNKDSTPLFCTDRQRIDCPALDHLLQPLFQRLPVSVVFDGILKEDRYHVFDVIDFADYRRGGTATPLHERHRVLTTLQEAGYLPNGMSVIPKIEVDCDQLDGAARVHKIAQRFRADGLINVVSKAVDAGYNNKRKSTAWRQVSD
jgi:hypothetical protein